MNATTDNVLTAGRTVLRFRREAFSVMRIGDECGPEDVRDDDVVLPLPGEAIEIDGEWRVLTALNVRARSVILSHVGIGEDEAPLRETEDPWPMHVCRANEARTTMTPSLSEGERAATLAALAGRFTRAESEHRARLDRIVTHALDLAERHNLEDSVRELLAQLDLPVPTYTWTVSADLGTVSLQREAATEDEAIESVTDEELLDAIRGRWLSASATRTEN